MLMLSSCTTYYFTTSSLISQLPKVDSSVPTDKRFNNNLARAKVTDKSGKEFIVNVTLHTGVRITSKTGEHKIVMFDTMFIKDSLLCANKSHFINAPIKPFKISDITKLELQN